MKAPRANFAARVVRWQRRHGRHDLPWQATRDAYRIWLSEVMLQQTQVAAVVPYFERFLARFPDVASLAAASEDDVLGLWSGLGYYARARNLHAAAKRVMAAHGGRFPSAFEALVELPGVGRSTAGAIAAFASGERRAILDGNVKRVIARHAGIGGDAGSPPVVAKLWAAAEEHLPARTIEPYTQGLMDLGAGVCLARAPRCDACPVAADCVARSTDSIARLPGRKRVAPRTRRSVAMLVAIRAAEVLLEKRPPRGIWGGLWSLPEMPANAKPSDFLRRRFGLQAACARRLEPFEHAFTHFTLSVTPWLVSLGTDHKPQPGLWSVPKLTIWLPLAELEGAALPAPVRRLLHHLRQSGSAAGGSDAGSPGAPKRRAARGASASRRS